MALLVSGILSGFLAGCGGGQSSQSSPAVSNTQIDSLSPSMVDAGSGSFQLTVTGADFAQGDVVLWGGSPLTSTFVSSTKMTAQVPASAVASPGSEIITVTPNPPPALQFGSAMFTIAIPPLSGNSSYSVSTVSVQANDMAWDPLSQQIYLSVPGSNGSNDGTIIALNPATVQLGASVSAGGEANKLAVSSDGSYLYAGIDSNSSVQRFTLPGLVPDISIPLGAFAAGATNWPLEALDVEVDPQNPHTIAVSRGSAELNNSEQGGIAIYDDAAARAASVPGEGQTGSPGPIDALTWLPDGSSLYGINSETPEPGYQLFVLSVDSNGVQLTHSYQSGSFAPQSGSPIYGDHAPQYDPTTGYLYSDSGYVIDPSTGNQAGSFPLGNLQGGLVADAMVPDGTLGLAYFLGQTEWGMIGPPAYVLAVYDLTHFNLIGAVAIGSVDTSAVSPVPTRLIRWGANGLAALCGGKVFLISGPFVTSPARRN